MPKHNQVLPSAHFRKNWARRVRTWFDQVCIRVAAACVAVCTLRLLVFARAARSKEVPPHCTQGEGCCDRSSPSCWLAAPRCPMPHAPIQHQGPRWPWLHPCGVEGACILKSTFMFTVVLILPCLSPSGTASLRLLYVARAVRLELVGYCHCSTFHTAFIIVANYITLDILIFALRGVSSAYGR